MGLFHRDTYHCGICGTQVSKNTTRVEGDCRLCDNCDTKVRSEYVDRGIRKRMYNNKYYYYDNIDLKQMHQMQDFFAEAKNRANHFVPTYSLGDFCIDQEHGWFFIDQDAINYKKQLKHNKPLEIYSVNDISRLEYSLQLSDTSKYVHIYFYFKNKLLPYDTEHTISLSGKLFEFEETFKKRMADSFHELCQYFPDITKITPEDKSRFELESYYSQIEAEIDDLTLKRVALNNQVDLLFEGNLPDKYVQIARQYLNLDNLLSNYIDSLTDQSSFSSASKLKECKESAVSCLTQMMKIYINLQKALGIETF